jgi:hypothetical protein
MAVWPLTKVTFSGEFFEAGELQRLAERLESGTKLRLAIHETQRLHFEAN